jgi:hypothetical protein
MLGALHDNDCDAQQQATMECVRALPQHQRDAIFGKRQVGGLSLDISDATPIAQATIMLLGAVVLFVVLVVILLELYKRNRARA